MVPAQTPLGRSIGRTARLVRAWGDRSLVGLDSSVTEWIVLFNIGKATPPGASQAEIARYSDMGSPALVRHIDRMEADGLVLRTRDAVDRRTIRLNLTPAGHEHLEALRTVMARSDAQLRSLLTEEEADALQLALDKLFAFCLGELYGEDAARHADPTAPSPDGADHASPGRRT